MTDPEGGPSSVTVVVATRDRPTSAAESARRILASDYPNFGLVIVDQSSTEETRHALAPLEADTRLRLISSPTIGLAAARNIGVRNSESPLIAFTDDDCRAEPDWLSCLVRAFQRDPGVGLVFGTMRAAEYDRDAGFILAYQPTQTRIADHLRDKAHIEGIGGSMAVSRTTWKALGGFDEMLGAGAPFMAGEETDLAVRALLGGIAVCETPEPVVTHVGFHEWPEAPHVVAGYMFGLGAVYTKMLRLGRAQALKPLGDLAWRWVAGRPAADLNHLPSRSLRLRQFLKGSRAALALKVDAETGHFVPPTPP